MANGAKGQKAMKPGKASSFANFDTRTAGPTKGGTAGIKGSPGGGNVQHGRGPTGVLGPAKTTGFIKPGGNPTGGSGGKAC
jgi:hypothetical protein